VDYIKYTRTFVMMEEQTSEFRGSRPLSKGYLKIETGNNKGALRCIVQNLKYYSRGEYIYKLILFGKDKDKVLNSVLGSLAINRYGNGETYFRFDPLNVDGQGSCYADFTVAVVAAVSGMNDKEALRPVLKGIMGRGKDSGNEVDKGELVSESIEEAIECQDKQEPVNFNSFYNEYLLQFCGYTCKSASFYQDVFPFEKDITGARWKKIGNVASLPLVSPGAHLFATHYKHFLFGAKPDSEGIACRYYFAVPGRFIKEEQPDGGRSGFTFWQPISKGGQSMADDSIPGNGYGYWIVAVDANTGDIVEAT
jgi:hypothetical protein